MRLNCAQTRSYQAVCFHTNRLELDINFLMIAVLLFMFYDVNVSHLSDFFLSGN